MQHQHFQLVVVAVALILTTHCVLRSDLTLSEGQMKITLSGQDKRIPLNKSGIVSVPSPHHRGNWGRWKPTLRSCNTVGHLRFITLSSVECCGLEA